MIFKILHYVMNWFRETLFWTRYFFWKWKQTRMCTVHSMSTKIFCKQWMKLPKFLCLVFCFFNANIISKVEFRFLLSLFRHFPVIMDLVHLKMMIMSLSGVWELAEVINKSSFLFWSALKYVIKRYSFSPDWSWVLK